jgi:basic membrane protein A
MKNNGQVLIGLMVGVILLGLMGVSPAAQAENSFDVAFLGDVFGTGGFWDVARGGIERAEKQLGVNTKVVEMGTEPSKWKPAIRSMAATGRYELIITGAPTKAEPLKEIAPQFPDQKFLLVDGKLAGVKNVYSTTYAQNEGSFLGGVLAGLVTNGDYEKLPDANEENVVGFVGLLDHPIINDFLKGYRQGVHYVDPEAEVLVSYVGSLNNPPKAKELAKVQYGKGADIIFTPASANNIGVIEAAKAEGGYVVGSDANQNPLAPGVVLTSVYKKVGNTVFETIKKALTGFDNIDFGTTRRLDYPKGAGLAKDKYYAKYVPDGIKLRVAEIARKLKEGEIDVASTITDS